MDGRLTEIPYEDYIKDCGHDTSSMLFDVFAAAGNPQNQKGRYEK